MNGLSIVLLTAFMLVCAPALQAKGWEVAAVNDSIHLRGTVAVSADTAADLLKLQVTLGDVILSKGDSVEMRVRSTVRMVGWASGPWGRLQFETPINRQQDSVTFALIPDSLGIQLCWPGDTIRWAWKPSDAGCFPAISDVMVEDIIEAAMRRPFESARHEMLAQWMGNQCVTIEQLKRLVAVFDDEARKLSIIQSANCNAPANIKGLASVFSSQYYASAFMDWARQLP